MSRYAGLALAALLGGFTAAGAATLHVRPDGTGDYPTIQAAVDAASDGDVILLADGVFRGDGNWDVQVLDIELTIRSESGDPARTVIDCAGGASPHRAFRLSGNPMVVIEGISMINGAGSSFYQSVGGAVLMGFCNAVFSHCVFARNSAWAGGAICTDWFTNVSLVSCTFHANEATSAYGGSALFVIDLCSGHLSNCIVAFGVGPFAIQSWSGPLQLECCDLYGNEGGDYVQGAAGQLGVNGNICADPLFCDPENLDLSIAADSPCAPGGECGLMGALPVGCGPTPAEATTWGAIKALYR
ncbi:MAG: hypothetical protein FJY75_07745 [Candidatus Eisenbacteria bacterium]|uniref:Right handed beta helix domain-containing protein n=1 Tax=Eiseniibacteriota bacterium TaxID=2212470 RepID=A0A938BRD6_UNCEI|nr:hypothetical protein [Candidatus Eisenbacteria bacterium]